MIVALLNAGHKITVIRKNKSRKKKIYLNNFKINVVSLQDFTKSKIKYTAFIHTSTSYGKSGEPLFEINKKNVLYPLQLLNTCMIKRVRYFINTDTALIFNSSEYSLSKFHFYNWGAFFAKNNNINFINVKLQSFFGEGTSKKNFVTFLINSCLSEAKTIGLSEGRQKREFIHIDDVISAYLLIISNLEKYSGFEQFEIGSEEQISIRRLASFIKKATRSKIKFIFDKNKNKNINAYPSNLRTLKKIGWRNKYTLKAGLLKVIEHEKSKT